MAGIRGVARRTARRTSKRQMAMAQGGSEPEGDVPAQEVGNESDYLDELEKLAELHEKGILTDEEFQAKKKQLLGQ